MLGAGQDGKAIVHSVCHTGGIIDLHKVGHEAGGNDDAQNDFGQLIGNGVGLAVCQSLLAPAQNGGGAHRAEGNAHSIRVAGDMIPGGYGGFIMFGHRVAHTGPEVNVGRVGNDFGVDKDMRGRSLAEDIFPQASVRMIHDTQIGAGSTGGSDGGEGEEGTVGLIGQYLAGVNGLAAADCKDHVGIRYLRSQHFHILAGGFAAIPEGADNFHIGFGYGCGDGCAGGLQCALAADDGNLLAISGADIGNVIIGIGAYGISGKKRLLHNHKSFLCNA